MYSLIDIRDTRAMTAEQKLIEIEKPIENLQLTLSLLTKMQQDIALEAEKSLPCLLAYISKSSIFKERSNK